MALPLGRSDSADQVTTHLERPSLIFKKTVRERSGALAAFIVTVGVVAVAAAVIKTFDARAVWRAVEGADFSFLFLALVLGAFLQVLRAQRAALLLRREHQISLEQCFGAQVLSHT